MTKALIATLNISQFEFFKIAANMFFLLISLLQIFTNLNPETSRVTTAGPLFVVLIVSMSKQALEDSKRHFADKQMNSRKVNRVKVDGTIDSIKWHEVRVGDLLLLRDREEFAADCILITTSDEGGKCFTETANLDGILA